MEFSNKIHLTNAQTGCYNYYIRSKQEADELIDLFKEKIKHLDTKKKNNFELKEGKSALKQFATQYGIDGKTGYDANHFFEKLNHSS